MPTPISLSVIYKIISKCKNKFRSTLRVCLKNDVRDKARDELICKWRGWDNYTLDEIKSPAATFYIEKALPSEPPGGVVYEFGPSGYITSEKDTEYCVIHTERNNINNYCHWTFNEVPLMLLALESSAKNIVFPDAIIEASLPFQARWLEVLIAFFPEKNIMPLSRLHEDINGIIPVNHDTSTSDKPLGNCKYMDYHAGRATPYCIEAIKAIKHRFEEHDSELPKRFYIKRSDARLVNDDSMIELLRSMKFNIVILEELSLDAQVQLFTNADCVIGVHGAGLTNIIFCDDSTKIIEIGDRNMIHPSYIDGIVIPGKKATRTYFHMLAHMKGLPYSFIESENYIVDIPLLVTTINEMGVCGS